MLCLFESNNCQKNKYLSRIIISLSFGFKFGYNETCSAIIKLIAVKRIEPITMFAIEENLTVNRHFSERPLVFNNLVLTDTDRRLDSTQLDEYRNPRKSQQISATAGDCQCLSNGQKDHLKLQFDYQTENNHLTYSNGGHDQQQPSSQ